MLVTGQPIVIDDLQQDPRFARQAAERTGYVPKGLMAVPLVNGENTLGVLQVLDRSNDRAFSLGEIDLLILFANQAAIGLDLMQTARRARAVAERGEGGAAVVARIASIARALGGRCRGAAAARGARGRPLATCVVKQAEREPTRAPGRDAAIGPGPRGRGAPGRLFRELAASALPVEALPVEALLGALVHVALEVRTVVIRRGLGVARGVRSCLWPSKSASASSVSLLFSG